jgi:hypothetical protein
MRLRPILTVACALLLAVASSSAAQGPATREQPVFVNEQQTVTPGFAIGNIAIGDPKVADFKVMPGRKEVLIFGKVAGRTRLTLWDQQNVKRDEIDITVGTRQSQQVEADLRELLKDFPSVDVRFFAGQIAVTGAVSSKDDLAAIEKIAAAAKARNLVRYVAPTGVETGSAAISAGASATTRPAAVTAASEIEYEIELLEASSKFRSGSYATGVEPSGRSLYKGMVRAALGVEREVFIGGNAVTTAVATKGSSKGASTQSSPQTVQTGIKLVMRPVTSDARGRFKTAMMIETNLPFSGESYDPTIWRRARWEFTAGSGEPFGITGGDLLATPDASNAVAKGSAIGSTTRNASKVASLPGVSMAPGAQLVPVFGSLFGSRSYQQKATQLLVILRPRVVAPQP